MGGVERRPPRPPLLGIVGGLGPLASAELVRTIYRLHVGDREQHAPGLVLYSDPSFPDRTEALLAGAGDELAARLATAIESVLAAGARRVVVACLTIHHVLPRLPPHLRRPVISLVDLALDAVAADPRPRLLLATDGTRARGVFEAHARWADLSRSLVLPSDDDQRTLHRWIYRLKGQAPAEPFADWLGSQAAAYGVEGFLFGCTELHLLQPLLERRRTAWAGGVVDPLRIVAQRLPELLASEGESAGGDAAAAAQAEAASGASAAIGSSRPVPFRLARSMVAWMRTGT